MKQVFAIMVHFSLQIIILEPLDGFPVMDLLELLGLNGQFLVLIPLLF